MELRISSPCPKRWNDLVGDDRVRYCGDCKLNVYNLAEMRPPEIEALVRRTSGRLCGQLYVRADRAATLRDCPTARTGILRRRLWKAAVAFLVLIVGLAFRALERPDTRNLPSWLQAVAGLIEPEKPRGRVRVVGDVQVVGKIRCVPPPPPPTVLPPPPAGATGN
jgi:hypothetical protein